ncbi:uncharacterized protein LOC121688641 [Alosa sapidissima]|uniref:uncharacterized protein LOC121688641 n=1 Tax=Alosa sapidissima TaxID=34773 RepID=UPI001C092E2D|nr:uncharacterized protein LOC121688641 [Alosa sapidissima]
MEFYEALRERGVAEENITRMIEDKVDHDVMAVIDDDTLSRYIPHLGDRVFARNWTNGECHEDRRRILIDRLRSKMKLPCSGPAPTATQTHSRKSFGVGNKNAEKNTRKIEVGWMNYHNGVLKQVRRPTGGGTREVIVRKDETMKNILEDGKRMFFPNGKSTKGQVDDFEFTLCVMGSEVPLEDTLSIASLYDLTRHKILRLYVCTKKKNSETNFNDTPRQDSSLVENTCITLQSSSSFPDCQISLHSPVMPVVPHEMAQLMSTSSPVMSTCAAVIPHSNEDDEVQFLGDSVVILCDDASDTLVYTPEVPPQLLFENLLTDSDVSPMCDDSSSSFYENPENVAERQTLTIRSAHCMSDLIKAFSDPNILDANVSFQRVLENGDIENGVGNGLNMDCLTEFWGKFYLSRTCGTTFKVPTLHHTYKEREWEAVARIVAFGWQKYKYLPIELAPPFLLEAFSIPTSTCSLMEAFFNYISPSEKDALTEALNDFHQADLDELLTILGSHSCTSLPTELNLAKLLDEIAHKELVQEPAFIIKCWKPILKSITERDSLTTEVMAKTLIDLKPKARNVTKCTNFPREMSHAERTTSLHLLRFIREMNDPEIGLFLRYCTGSDLFLGKMIQVTFVNMPDFARRPVAHTCSCALELASNYTTFSEFRSEFLAVLKSGIWVMDMA